MIRGSIRLSTVRAANRIVVMKHGQIAEVSFFFLNAPWNTHQSLILLILHTGLLMVEVA